MQIRHSTEIAAPIADVWDLTIDVQAWPSVTPTVTAVDPLDDQPMGVGSKFRIEQPAQRARTWTVTSLAPKRAFGWSTRAMGMTMTATHELTPSDRGTRNTLTIDLGGGPAPLLGRLLAPLLRKALATENQAFKTVAEALSREGGDSSPRARIDC